MSRHGIDFLVCRQLIVRTDIAATMEQSDHKIISDAECKSIKAGNGCINRGLCIEARVTASWKRPTRTTGGFER